VADRVSAYASAIFDLAMAEDELETVEKQLFVIARTLRTSDTLRDSLANPQLPIDRRQGIIDDLLGSRASTLTHGLVSFLVGQDRASDLPEIVDRFVEIAAESRSKAVAEIRSALPLDEATVDRLAAALSRVTGKSLEVKTIVDPAVVGGILARVGDTVIDGSVARRLAELREVLKTS
jgi:F-type H+-transporting ATPase subunit delta